MVDRSGQNLGKYQAHWVLLALGVIVSSSPAQPPPVPRQSDAFINQQRAIENRLRREFQDEVGQRQRAVFDWGGWSSRYFFAFDDGVKNSRTLQRSDLRLWGRLLLDHGTHQFYARARLSLLDFNNGDSYDGNDHDLEGPNLERGFYRFDFARASLARGDAPPEHNVVLLAGRDLVQFGTGLSLATPLDHVSLRITYRGLELTGFAGRTISSAQDFDLSRTAKRTRRDLAGAQLKYLAFERHEPFLFAFWQQDRNRETVHQPLQRYDYDSFHLGFGSTGELVKGLRYSTEWVYQTGRNFHQGRPFSDRDIDAWAVVAELEYLFAKEHKARVSFEYLFGSGDADRLSSPTNTLAGNVGDSVDSSFVGFGYRDTGLSFAPRYANLHLWRVGGSCYPWPGHDRLGRLELGTDWYLYYKHHRSGAVSDPTASVQAGYLGWEMDYFVNWRIKTDLAWTVRGGLFFPGKAFNDRGQRPFLLVGMTWSF